MTNKEILQKAIDKAIDGGWEQEQPTFSGRPEWPNIHIRADDYSPKDIIFNHEFAKALWGDRPTISVNTKGRDFVGFTDLPKSKPFSSCSFIA